MDRSKKNDTNSGVGSILRQIKVAICNKKSMKVCLSKI